MSNLATDLIAAGEVTAIAEGQPIMPMYPMYPGYMYYSPMSGKVALAIMGMFVFIIILAMLFGNKSTNNTSNMTGGTPEIPCNCNKNH